MIKTTLGRLLVNESLPEHLRDYNAVVDNKYISDLYDKLLEIGDPVKYRDVTLDLHRIGARSAYERGSSFSIRDLQTPPRTKARIKNIRNKIQTILNDPSIKENLKEQMIKKEVSKATEDIESLMFEEALKNNNPFASQVISKARGKKGDMRSIMVGDMLMTDHKDRIVPVPVLRSYSAGVTPAEYWVGAYGARKGLLSTKIATADTGYYGKQLKQAAHRLVVTEPDCGTETGLPVEKEDRDNIGAVLARDYGDYPAGTIIDSDTLRNIKDDNIVVRSLITCQSKSGVCSKCSGVRASGGLPDIGTTVGITAAQAISEPTTQLALSEKHQGGRAKPGATEDNRIKGFRLVEQLVSVPGSFKDAAAVSSIDGRVESISAAPQGGTNIIISGDRHFVPEGFSPLVKVGENVEAGDVISDGIPNPAEIVKYKGIGEGRRVFMETFKKAYTDQGVSANRRNVEAIARGLINHIDVSDLDSFSGALPGDTLEYSAVEREYAPRMGSTNLKPNQAIGQYLEKPVLHYTIGTRITKSIANRLQNNNIGDIVVNRDEPSFQPRMVRAVDTLLKSPDWKMRLGGFNLQKGLLEAAQRGRGSDLHGVSYIPALTHGKNFGKELETKGIF